MTSLNPFQLERYFARYEFTAPYLLSPSDCESLRQDELLAMADPEATGLWNNLSLGYTESLGHPVLRAEIAGLYETASPQDVLVLSPEEGIFIAMQTLLAPGDEVIAIHPAYQSLQEVARSLGCPVTLWSVGIQDGAWALDLDGLERCVTSRTRLLVINFPHNPTGYLPSRSELDAILDFARRHDLIVFSDEMYRLLEYDPAARLPSLVDIYAKAVVLSGMSKTLALPGLRIGWLVTHNQEWFGRFANFKDYTTICSSAPSEILALIGVRSRQQIVKRNLEIIAANLQTAVRFFAAHPQLFAWIAPRAGSVAFPRWTGGGPVEAFCQALVDRAGVALAPGSLFDFPGDHFRLGLGRKNFAEGLRRVGEFLSTNDANFHELR